MSRTGEADKRVGGREYRGRVGWCSRLIRPPPGAPNAQPSRRFEAEQERTAILALLVGTTEEMGSRAVVAISACNFRLLGLSGRSIAFATLAFERSRAAIALNVHLQDRGVVHEPVDGCQRHVLSVKILPHSPNGWLAVISRDRRS